MGFFGSGMIHCFLMAVVQNLNKSLTLVRVFFVFRLLFKLEMKGTVGS